MGLNLDFFLFKRIVFPRASDYPIGVILNFRKFAKIFSAQGGTPPYSMTPPVANDKSSKLNDFFIFCLDKIGWQFTLIDKQWRQICRRFCHHYRQGGSDSKIDWCMNQAGVRYSRIPDPAHVLSARGWARGEERKTDNHRKRSPIKIV